MKIAFFDSGIGGLTVLKKAIREMPDNEYMYYADTENVPYGIKSREEVRTCIFAAADFISGQQVDALVLACNTATSVAVSDLRERYTFPIIGMEPAVKPAILHNHGKNILVLATSLTLRESKLESLINALDRGNRTVKMEMDELVRFAESFDFGSSGVRHYLHAKISGVQPEKIETIVLGCTHFIFYKTIIRDIVGDSIQIIDGNTGTINNLKRILAGSASPETAAPRSISFYSSGVRDNPEREARLREILKDGE